MRAVLLMMILACSACPGWFHHDDDPEPDYTGCTTSHVDFAVPDRPDLAEPYCDVGTYCTCGDGTAPAINPCVTTCDSACVGHGGSLPYGQCPPGYVFEDDGCVYRVDLGSPACTSDLDCQAGQACVHGLSNACEVTTLCVPRCEENVDGGNACGDAACGTANDVNGIAISACITWPACD